MSDIWMPRLAMFQCQYNQYSPADREWLATQLPQRIKHIQVPCTGRISPLMILNAVQGGVDGILICGCLPEKCHFKTGNLGARRQLDEFRSLLTYLGMEEERIRFAWIDATERGRARQELISLEETVASLGQVTRLSTRVTVHV